jgi:Gluconate 2-dehydrogenase subunit 3
MELLDSHVQIVAAIASRVVPGDDEQPGGDSEEVMRHVAEVMTGQLGPRLAELRVLADDLNIAAKIKYYRRFADLIPDDQTEILQTVQDAPIFKTLVELVQEGYWASEAGQKRARFETT